MVSKWGLQARTKALFWSYGRDWLLVLVVLAAFGYVETLEPFHRQFSVKDTTIQHPFAKKETIPIWLCGVIAFIVPAVIIACVSIFHQKSYRDLHNGILGLFLAAALILMVTDSVKIGVGRPRPDFLDRCLRLYDSESEGTPLASLSDPINMLSSDSICTRRELLKDGYKSFPSGHSSFSFGGLGYLSMYLAGKLHLFDERGHIYKSVVVLIPMIVAAMIAISRVDDYRHHWQDVTVGSLIGVVFAVFSYRQYYPSLGVTKSNRPFKSRILLDEILPSHQHSRLEDEPEHEHQRETFLNGGVTGAPVASAGGVLNMTAANQLNNYSPYGRGGMGDDQSGTSLRDLGGANR